MAKQAVNMAKLLHTTEQVLAVLQKAQADQKTTTVKKWRHMPPFLIA
jgi:hypothetical protein